MRSQATSVFLEKHFWLLAAVLLLVSASSLVLSIVQESQTVDEGVHLAAGYSHWRTGDFRLNVEHPPLFRLLAALPLLLLQPDFSPLPANWQEVEEYPIGKDFLYRNRVDADTLLFAGRSMTILLSLAFGAAVAGWSKRRFGAPAGLFTLLLLTFDPNMIAHGRYVTSDMALTVFYFLSCVCWLAYLESKTNGTLLATGILAGLTINVRQPFIRQHI